MAGARKDPPLPQTLKPSPDEAGVDNIKLSKEEEISFRLTEERRQKLEDIGFVWSVRESDAKADQNRITRNSYDDLWDAMYDRLKLYKEKYGVRARRPRLSVCVLLQLKLNLLEQNCLVPKRSKEDPKLGTWVSIDNCRHVEGIGHLDLT